MQEQPHGLVRYSHANLNRKNVDTGHNPLGFRPGPNESSSGPCPVYHCKTHMKLVKIRTSKSYSLAYCFPVQEYKRLETLRQIKEADRRTEEMATRKEEMINQRRRAALEVSKKPLSNSSTHDD